MIEAVVYGTLAFKAWGFIAPLLEAITWRMGALGASATFATGPIGWIVAGVGALAAVLTVAVLANQNATKATGEYTAAVQADSGTIGENVRLKAARALLDNGAYDLAKKLGISTKLVTDAVLNETGARKQLKGELDEVLEKQARLQQQGRTTGTESQILKGKVGELSGKLKEQSGDIGNSVKDYQTLQEALGTTTSATSAQQSAVERNAAAAGVSAAPYLAAKDAQVDTKLETDKTTAAMYIQSDAAGLLKQSLDLLNGETLNAAQAQNQFDSGLANMADHMDKTGGNRPGEHTSHGEHCGRYGQPWRAHQPHPSGAEQRASLP